MTDTTPEPITADLVAGAVQDRVLFENEINAGAEDFANQARDAYIAAKLAGHDISITVEGGEEAADDHEGIAPETALALAADEGLVPYSEWSKEELAEECRTRGLSVSGTKDALIDRLEASDAADVTSEDDADPEAE